MKRIKTIRINFQYWILFSSKNQKLYSMFLKLFFRSQWSPATLNRNAYNRNLWQLPREVILATVTGRGLEPLTSRLWFQRINHSATAPQKLFSSVRTFYCPSKHMALKRHLAWTLSQHLDVITTSKWRLFDVLCLLVNEIFLVVCLQSFCISPSYRFFERCEREICRSVACRISNILKVWPRKLILSLFRSRSFLLSPMKVRDIRDSIVQITKFRTIGL